MKITYIQFNWHQYMDRTEAGENYECYEVGKNCKRIEQLGINHYEVTIDDNSFIQLFNVNLVKYSK